MKTLAAERCRTEIAHRLATVHAGSAARWGRMSAHQMICHLCDSCRLALGERSVSPATGLLQRTLVKWIALYVPLAWPAGIATRPEVDQEHGGTTPGEFAADVSAHSGAPTPNRGSNLKGQTKRPPPTGSAFWCARQDSNLWPPD